MFNRTGSWFKPYSLTTMMLLLSLLHVSAQRSYSLEECLQMALNNNLEIKSAASDMTRTEQQIAETRAALLPQISGEYNFTYNPNLPPTFLPGFIVGQPDQENVAAVLGLKQTQYAELSASQQLFNPQLFIALKAVKTANRLSALQLGQVKEDVAYNVSATYYNLLSLYQSIELLRANVASFETTIQTTQTLVRNDLAKDSDVNRLVLAQKALQTQLMNLQVTESKLLNILKLLTNSPGDEPFAIDTTLNSTIDLLATGERTVVNRSDYQLLQTSIDLNEIERKSVLATYLPTIVLFGGYFSYAYNVDFNPSERAENQSFPVSQIGLSLKVPIFDGGERHARTRQKSLELQKLNYQKQLLEQQAQYEIIDAVEQYNTNVAILKKEEDNMALAQTTLEEVKVNYRNGFLTINDIIEAENDLQQTQTDYLTALVNVRLAVLEWKKANGTLLQFNN